MKLSSFCFLVSVAAWAATESASLWEHPEMPAGAEQIYRFDDKPDRYPSFIYATRKGELAISLGLEGSRPVRGILYFYSSTRGTEVLKFLPELEFEESRFREWGSVAHSMQRIARSEPLFAVPYRGKCEIVFQESIFSGPYLNDEGLIVLEGLKYDKDEVKQDHWYYVRWPGKPLESFDEYDPRAAKKRFLIDPLGHVCEASRFEGSRSPLAQLSKESADTEKPRMSPLLPVAAINERYGLVYTLRDPKSFQVQTYSLADDVNTKIFEAMITSMDWSRSLANPVRAEIRKLADNGDMLLTISGPMLESARANGKSFLYRRGSNQLIELRLLPPEGDELSSQPWMNNRGDVVFCARRLASKIDGFRMYVLWADATKPTLVDKLSEMPAPISQHVVTDEGRLYFVVPLSDGSRVLGLVADPTARASWRIYSVVAAVAIAVALLSWRVQHKRRVKTSAIDPSSAQAG